MKKLTFFIFVFFITFNSYAVEESPMAINIVDNPVSLNGTYEIERFVILKDKRIFIDSADHNSVSSSKGQVTIDLNITGNMVNSTLKMQMKGNIFAEGSAFAGYDFIFSSRVIPMPADTKEKKLTLEEKTSAIGLHYYKNENRIIWEIPFEQDKIIIMILDKESNTIKNLSRSKYMFL